MTEQLQTGPRRGRPPMAREAAPVAAEGLASLAATPVAETTDEPAMSSRITRETRKPFGSTSQKLAYPDRPGYHRHWFNDNPGRIEGAQDAGYTHVQDSRKGTNVERVVGTREGGHPIVAFLMEIPQEWFDDDMKAYEEQVAGREAAIVRGQVEKASPQDASKYYPTAQGRNITLTRR